MVELTESFLLESEGLDKDHQQLADILNEIMQMIDDGNAGECKRLVPKFIQAAKAHFAKEEAFLVKIGYPNVKKHKDHHRGLNDKMDHMLEFGRMAEENELARENLRKELLFFLMDDVITTDLEFKKYIEDNTVSRNG
jgi:hemerythrin